MNPEWKEKAIPVDADYIKVVGGKAYRVNWSTTAAQVKLRDGRSLQDQADTVEEYFRLSQSYVSELAENAKDSEDAAKASERAAAASQAAALLSEQHALQSQRQCAAAQEHCEQIAADVDAAIENAAYEQITERVVPRVIEDATTQAVDQIVPEVTDRLWAEAEEHLSGIEENLFFELGEAVEQQNAAIQRCCEENKELILDVKDSVEEEVARFEANVDGRLLDHALSTTKQVANLGTTIDRNTLAIDALRQEHSEDINDLLQIDNMQTDRIVSLEEAGQARDAEIEHINAELAEINERIVDETESIALAHTHDIAQLAHTDMLQAVRIEANTDSIAQLAHTNLMQAVRIENTTSSINALEKYVKNAVQEAILRFTKEQAVQASINSKLQVIGTEFTQHQINDTERFSNLSLASVIHSRKLLEAREEHTEFVLRSVCSDIKLAHTLMLQQVYAAQYYVDSQTKHLSVGAFQTTDGTTIHPQGFSFVPADGSGAVAGTDISFKRS